MFANRLQWKYFNPKNDSQPVASLYTENDTRILDVFVGNNFYYTSSTEAIPSLRQCIQISYKNAVAALDDTVSSCYLSFTVEKREQYRLESACRIIESKIINYMVNSFLSQLDI